MALETAKANFGLNYSNLQELAGKIKRGQAAGNGQNRDNDDGRQKYRVIEL